MKVKIAYHYPEIIGSLLCLVLGMLSGVGVEASDMVWYNALHKPVFNPPAWVFGPVWALLYLMMGVVLGRLWKDRKKNWHLIVVFIIQLVFNLLWSTLFFHCHRIGWALLDLSALWVSLVVFLAWALHQRVIMGLFLPYFVWVSFALILNLSLYSMNG